MALLVARAIQDAGAALLSPATLTIISTHYQAGPARNRAFGIWAAVAAVGNASGMLVGGILTNALSWRAVLFVNLPIAALAALLAARALPKPDRRRPPIEASTSPAGSPSGRPAHLVYAIQRTTTAGWISVSTLVLLAASGLLLAAFILIETHLRSPLIPLAASRDSATC